MFQLPLFREQSLDRIINVASVPHRSPFRYPGGKTWIVPHIRLWLASLSALPEHFVEPFAGGAIVGLTVAAERLARHVTLVELDDQVAAVWMTIFCDDGGAEWLAQRIIEFQVTLEAVQDLLSKPAGSTRELAFQTILKNRVYHGGILAPGSAPIKYGENGKGIRSRWYPQTLQRRILALIPLRERVTFIHGDGLEVLGQNPATMDHAYFIDPPYTAGSKRAGTRLYTHYTLDHERLFQIVSALKSPWLMTYDHDPIIIALAEKHGFVTRPIAMKNTHHARMTELLVSRDLSWAAEASPRGTAFA